MTEPSAKTLSREQLQLGAAVRIVQPLLGTFEGVIEKTDDQYGRGFPDSIEVAGARFFVEQHVVEAVSEADLSPGRPAVLVPTAAQVVAAIESAGLSTRGKPYVSAPRNIFIGLIGFDAGNGLRSREYGGRSADGWFNQFVKVSAVKYTLDALVANGTIVKVQSGNRFQPTPDFRALEFRNVRSGYVTTVQHAQAHTALNDKAATERVAKLRAKAAANVAERHPDELEAELTRLIAEDS